MTFLVLGAVAALVAIVFALTGSSGARRILSGMIGMIAVGAPSSLVVPEPIVTFGASVANPTRRQTTSVLRNRVKPRNEKYSALQK